MRRILRLPVDGPPGSAAGARKAFQTSLIVATFRCLLMYIVFPFVLPAVGFAMGDMVITEHAEEWRFHTGEVALVKFVSVHEFDADGRPAAVLVTSGPGAGNTVTGLMTAMMDSVPMLVITGQTVTWMLGKDAFQEADIFGITIPVVKHNYLVKDTNALPRIAREAYHIATTGRPGPVLIDVPKDISQGPFSGEMNPPFNLPGYDPSSGFDICPKAIKRATDMIANAKRPVILAGQGCMIARADKHEKQPGVIRNFQRYQRPKKPNSSGLLPSEWKDYVGAGDASSEPVPNQFSTGGEKPPQMEDGGGSSDADASAPPNDPRIRLWSEGVDTLVSISGKTRDGAKALIGKWLKATDDDCALVLSRIRKAKLDRIGEPVSWITAALAKKADPPKARNAGVLALQQLRGMNLDDTSPQNRHLDAGDRNPSSASPGIARRVAVTGSG